MGWDDKYFSRGMLSDFWKDKPLLFRTIPRIVTCCVSLFPGVSNASSILQSLFHPKKAITIFKCAPGWVFLSCLRTTVLLTFEDLFNFDCNQIIYWVIKFEPCYKYLKILPFVFLSFAHTSFLPSVFLFLPPSLPLDINQELSLVLETQYWTKQGK